MKKNLKEKIANALKGQGFINLIEEAVLTELHPNAGVTKPIFTDVSIHHEGQVIDFGFCINVNLRDQTVSEANFSPTPSTA